MERSEGWLINSLPKVQKNKLRELSIFDLCFCKIVPSYTDALSSVVREHIVYHFKKPHKSLLVNV